MYLPKSSVLNAVYMMWIQIFPSPKLAEPNIAGSRRD